VQSGAGDTLNPSRCETAKLSQETAICTPAESWNAQTVTAFKLIICDSLSLQRCIQDWIV